MANVSKPTGFSPVKMLSGAQWNGAVNLYYVAPSQGTAIFIGDPVVSSGDGDPTYGYPGVQIAVAGSAVRGIVVAAGVAPVGQPGGGYFNVNNLTQLNVPASQTAAYYVAVVDDPNVIFEIQQGGTGTAFASADLGLNANFTLSTAGVAPFSGALLDVGNKGTTSTLNCRILQLAPRLDNAFGAFAKFWVKLNNHELSAGVAGV